MSKVTNEIKVLREFLREFSPFWNGKSEDTLESLTYPELVDEVKDTVKEM